MAWPSTVSAGQPALASQYNALLGALALWGGNVDAGGYKLANAAAVVLAGAVGIEKTGTGILGITNGAGTLAGLQCQNLTVNDSVNVANNVTANNLTARTTLGGPQLLANSPSTSATNLILQNTSIGAHTYILSATGSANTPGNLVLVDNTRGENIAAFDSSGGAGAAVRLKLGSDGFIGFTAATNAFTTPDVGILRTASKNLAVVDGTGAAATLTAATVAATATVSAPAVNAGTGVNVTAAGKITFLPGSGLSQFDFVQSSSHLMLYSEGNASLAAAGRASCIFMRCRGLVFGMAAGPSSDSSLVDGEGYFFLQVNGSNGKWQIWCKARVSGAVHLWNLGDWAS